uniref:Uncharacterized protein n=1 Tax=Anguilla anguilla TaxID=7936 RepID=A0A0E9W3S4_ANGAN
MMLPVVYYFADNFKIFLLEIAEKKGLQCRHFGCWGKSILSYIFIPP